MKQFQGACASVGKSPQCCALSLVCHSPDFFSNTANLSSARKPSPLQQPTPIECGQAQRQQDLLFLTTTFDGHLMCSECETIVSLYGASNAQCTSSDIRLRNDFASILLSSARCLGSYMSDLVAVSCPCVVVFGIPNLWVSLSLTGKPCC